MKFLALLIGLLIGFGHNMLHAQAHNYKIALVIGNTEYTYLPRLKNAANDAVFLARSLSDKGFTVFLVQNTTAKELQESLSFVAKRVADADQILIYYAGHGTIIDGKAHLLPTDNLGDNDPAASISTTELLSYFKIPFAQKAVILDMCLETEDTSPHNLYLPNAMGVETLLVFTTSFGHAAYDGKGAHSIFTGALLDHMATTKFSLQTIVQTVRKEVIRASRSHQIPISVSTLTRPYILTENTLNLGKVRTQNDRIQSYSSSGYADKPLLNIMSIGINPANF